MKILKTSVCSLFCVVLILLFIPNLLFANEIIENSRRHNVNIKNFENVAVASGIKDGWIKIEAETCDTLGPVDITKTGGILTYTADNPWVEYSNVDLHSDSRYILLHVANGGEDAIIQLLVDDIPQDTLNFETTGDLTTYKNKTFKLPVALSGVKNIKLVFLKGMLNIDWFQFSSDFPKKIRVVISTDFPPLDVCMSGCATDHTSDPDDVQSMVRFLLYANEFDIEGLIASSGTYANIAKKQNILDILNLYDQVDESLRKHDTLFPSADYLRSVTFQGRSGTWGGTLSNNIGAGKDSQASDSIISIVDRQDSRPVWFCFWGDCSNLAQAIWKVQNTRSIAELNTFLSKIRVYQIAHQDSTIDWMLNNFPNLFIIYSNSTYNGIFGGSGDPLGNLTWLNTHIRQNHGPLGAIYPPAAIGVDGLKEGDSPSFLYLVSATHGINNPEDPTQESWGGQYIRSGLTNHWVDGQGPVSVSKWKTQYQNEFASRADWMIDSSFSTQLPDPGTMQKGNNQKLTLYPNPAKNELTVISEFEIEELSIYNLGGRLVFTKCLDNKTKSTLISLNLTKGLYVLKINNHQLSAYSKMLIE